MISLFAAQAGGYDPLNWYWTFGNRADVFSSAVPGYVPTSDATYTAWVAAGNTASGGAHMADGELADVLTKAGIQGLVVHAVAPTSWGVLTTLEIIDAVSAAGCTITSTGTPAINATYQLSGEPWETMNSTQIYVNAHNQLPNNQPLPWGAYSGTVTIPTALDFTNLYQGLNDYLQSWKTWAYHGGTMPTWGTKTIA